MACILAGKDAIINLCALFGKDKVNLYLKRWIHILVFRTFVLFFFKTTLI